MKKPSAAVLSGPTATELRAALGQTQSLWSELLAHVEATYAPITQEWKRGGKTNAWFLRLRRKDRTVLYLLLRDGFFLTAFVFGEKATATVRASTFPAAVITALNAAHEFAEYRASRRFG